MKRNLLLFSLLFVLIHSVSPCEAEEYEVRKGETALQIAIDHNLTMDQLSRLNPGVDLEMMRVGDILIIPDGDSASFDDFLNKQYGDQLRVTDLNCTVAADGSAVCLMLAENLSDDPLFDVRLKAHVRGTNGSTGQAEADIALMQILPGEKLPVYISVPGNFGSVESASVDIVSLTANEKMRSSFRVSQELYTLEESFSPDRISASVTVSFGSQGIVSFRNKKINVFAAAYNTEGKLIGVRSLYSDFFQRLDITVYSDGGPIASVDIRVEAY